MLRKNNIVEKSKAIVWAKMSDYGEGELKILDTYLSRIDARRPESSRVTFTKKEYAELLGLDSDIRTSQLQKYTGRMVRPVTIKVGERSYNQYPLFNEVEVYPDEELGQVVITIDCHPKLKQAFFDLAQDGYIKYQLKNTIQLKSQYSIRLYTLLMARPYGWTVSVEELRERLNVVKKTYDEFKRFNDLILKKTIKEINEITNMKVDVEYIRKGRSCVALKFSPVITMPADLSPATPVAVIEAPKENEEENISLFENDIPDANDPMALFMSALPDYFDRDQAILLRDLALDHLPYDICTIEERELWLHDYVSRKVKLMAASRVENPFGWLRSAIEKDYK